MMKSNGLAKTEEVAFSVIPAKAGIQPTKALKDLLDPGFHRGDGFLQDH